MIPLNLWNKFDERTRTRIADTVWGCSIKDSAMYCDLAKPYHHNFAYSLLGSKVKATLSCLRLQKDGTIDIVISITPKYATETKITPQPKPVKRKVSYKQELEKKHFRLRYTDKSGDHTSIHLYAENAAEAKRKAKNEYWDIEEITECYEID